MLYIHAHLKPMILTILVLIISIIPFPFLESLFIPWFFIIIFLWQSDNDYSFNPIFIFLATLIFDFFSGGVLGLSSLLFLIFIRLIYNNRFILRGQTFQIKWTIFCIWLSLLFLVQYLLLSLIALSFIAIWPVLISLFLLCITYPIFRKVFKIHSE